MGIRPDKCLGGGLSRLTPACEHPLRHECVPNLRQPLYERQSEICFLVDWATHMEDRAEHQEKNKAVRGEKDSGQQTVCRQAGIRLRARLPRLGRKDRTGKIKLNKHQLSLSFILPFLHSFFHSFFHAFFLSYLLTFILSFFLSFFCGRKRTYTSHGQRFLPRGCRPPFIPLSSYCSNGRPPNPE